MREDRLTYVISVFVLVHLCYASEDQSVVHGFPDSANRFTPTESGTLVAKYDEESTIRDSRRIEASPESSFNSFKTTPSPENSSNTATPNPFFRVQGASVFVDDEITPHSFDQRPLGNSQQIGIFRGRPGFGDNGEVIHAHEVLDDHGHALSGQNKENASNVYVKSFAEVAGVSAIDDDFLPPPEVLEALRKKQESQRNKFKEQTGESHQHGGHEGHEGHGVQTSQVSSAAFNLLAEQFRNQTKLLEKIFNLISKTPFRGFREEEDDYDEDDEAYTLPPYVPPSTTIRTTTTSTTTTTLTIITTTTTSMTTSADPNLLLINRIEKSREEPVLCKIDCFMTAQIGIVANLFWSEDLHDRNSVIFSQTKATVEGLLSPLIADSFVANALQEIIVDTFALYKSTVLVNFYISFSSVQTSLTNFEIVDVINMGLPQNKLGSFVIDPEVTYVRVVAEKQVQGIFLTKTHFPDNRHYYFIFDLVFNCVAFVIVGAGFMCIGFGLVHLKKMMDFFKEMEELPEDIEEGTTSSFGSYQSNPPDLPMLTLKQKCEAMDYESYQDRFESKKRNMNHYTLEKTCQKKDQSIPVPPVPILTGEKNKLVMPQGYDNPAFVDDESERNAHQNRPSLLKIFEDIKFNNQPQQTSSNSSVSYQMLEPNDGSEMGDKSSTSMVFSSMIVKDWIVKSPFHYKQLEESEGDTPPPPVCEDEPIYMTIDETLGNSATSAAIPPRETSYSPFKDDSSSSSDEEPDYMTIEEVQSVDSEPMYMTVDETVVDNNSPQQVNNAFSKKDIYDLITSLKEKNILSREEKLKLEKGDSELGQWLSSTDEFLPSGFFFPHQLDEPELENVPFEQKIDHITMGLIDVIKDMDEANKFVAMIMSEDTDVGDCEKLYEYNRFLDFSRSHISKQIDTSANDSESSPSIEECDEIHSINKDTENQDLIFEFGSVSSESSSSSSNDSDFSCENFDLKKWLSGKYPDYEPFLLGGEDYVDVIKDFIDLINEEQYEIYKRGFPVEENQNDNILDQMKGDNLIGNQQQNENECEEIGEREKSENEEDELMEDNDVVEEEERFEDYDSDEEDLEFEAVGYRDYEPWTGEVDELELNELLLSEDEECIDDPEENIWLDSEEELEFALEFHQDEESDEEVEDDDEDSDGDDDLPPNFDLKETIYEILDLEDNHPFKILQQSCGENEDLIDFHSSSDDEESNVESYEFGLYKSSSSEEFEPNSSSSSNSSDEFYF